MNRVFFLLNIRIELMKEKSKFQLLKLVSSIQIYLKFSLTPQTSLWIDFSKIFSSRTSPPDEK